MARAKIRILTISKLVEAKCSLEHAQDKSSCNSATTRRDAEGFKQSQADIDRRLTIITNSDTADEAVTKFEEMMGTMRKFDIVNTYLAALQDVERMDTNAREQLQPNPNGAIAIHTTLSTFANHLTRSYQAVEGAAPHFVHYVETVSSNLTNFLKNEFAKGLRVVLEKALWPKRVDALPSSLLESFNASVTRLLALQKPALEYKVDFSKTDYELPDVLYPFEVLTEPLAQRFQYHFSGDRPTNRLDKPEYFFSHFFDLLNTHLDFINEYLQPLLLQKYSPSRIASSASYLDATPAFITALLPMIRRRIFTILPAILQQPSLLSHLIASLVQFDNTLRNDWRYDVCMGNTSSRWRGLTWEVLHLQGNFERWLSTEKSFALSRYEAIESDKLANNLDFDAIPSLTGVSVPTTAALRIHDLLTSVMAIYHDLQSFSQRLHFLIAIQIDILDRFHARLHSALEAYVTRTSSVGRAVQGVSTDELADLHGVGGLDRLMRIYGSAEYLEKAMRDWGDDVFFLDLWHELQTRSRQRLESEDAKVAMNWSDIAAKTSKLLDTRDDVEGLEGALFDETMESYARLRVRAEAVTTSVLTSAVRNSLKPWEKSASFASSVNNDDDTALTPSIDLSSAFQLLSSYLVFLGRVLAVAPLRRIIRELVTTVDDYVFERVVLTHDFSVQGARQLEADVKALLVRVETALGRKAGRINMQRSEAASRLLLLPDGTVVSGDTEATLTLWDVEGRLFATNEDARAVLADLGCASLTEGEARRVLKCRIELES